LTIQPSGQPASTAPTTWTFTAVPQTNLQSFNASIRSEHPWLAITLQGTAALAPSATPPTQLSTQGNYSSPRGCNATFGSLGTANATRIEATFHGVDCQVSFDGTVVLTKSGS
jgi:heat shock protein HslJ